MRNRKSQLSKPSSASHQRARRLTAAGYTEHTRCSCGNADAWDMDTDQMTGSSYARCLRCHRVHPFRTAYRDNALGLNFGSWWSQQLADGFVEEP